MPAHSSRSLEYSQRLRYESPRPTIRKNPQNDGHQQWLQRSFMHRRRKTSIHVFHHGASLSSHSPPPTICRFDFARHFAQCESEVPRLQIRFPDRCPSADTKLMATGSHPFQMLMERECALDWRADSAQCRSHARMITFTAIQFPEPPFPMLSVADAFNLIGPRMRRARYSESTLTGCCSSTACPVAPRAAVNAVPMSLYYSRGG